MEIKCMDSSKKPACFLGVRHLQVFMLFSGLVIAYSLRVNMSMAIVAMTDKTQPNAFDWSMQIQSVILSSFLWGYIFLQIPAGELAARFGGMILITISIGINATLSLLTPLAALYGGWQLLCACRVLQGLSQGFIFPSIHTLIGNWVPLEERSRLATIIFGGCQLGTAFQLIVSGFVADYWGWPAIFYVNGGLGAIWVAFYIFLGADSPRNSKIIGVKERLYIQSSLGHVGSPQKKMPTPWKAIFTSLPFISLILTHCGQNWGFWTLMTEIPSYMKQVLGVDIKANGLMSALPYISMYLLGFPMGFLSDYIIKKKWLSITASRKMFNSIGLYGPALALIGLSYVPAGDVTLAVLTLTLVVALNAGHYTGFLLVHIDMAPSFAGTLMGITNCISNALSIVAPLVAGAIISDENNPSEWRKVFYLSSAIYIIGSTFFNIFGSCEQQSWNTGEETEHEEKTRI
ncbi:putative inorganic phosphate cotransporter [Danaus plexippus]|uniref:putative inorganic phosphate cotransporter n=1 Tax=Danaus plexippus TaxID=13037 RepID=UPI002AAFF6D2|nr:putative inorganic phosphate cotransporter [Danaus plexippus]